MPTHSPDPSSEAQSSEAPSSDPQALDLTAGDRHYRAYVGPPEFYDRVALLYVKVLDRLGLTETSSVLDIGCGSLRGGKLLIPYLLPGRYFGIEPNAWLIDEGVDNELGKDILRVKRPRFDHNDRFDCSVFGTRFDYAIAQSIFSHASSAQIEACLASVLPNLAERGVFVFTYWPGDTDYTGDEWVYPGTTGFTRGYWDRTVSKFDAAVADLDIEHPAGQKWLVCGSESAVTQALS